MIRLEKQQFLKFEIEGYDFIDNNNFIKFVAIEQAGNYLPEFELDFLTQDLDLLKSIKESIPIKVTFGSDISESITSSFLILEKEFSKAGDTYRVNLKGIYNIPTYIYQAKIRYFEDTSINTIRQVVSSSFMGLDVTLKTSRDKQVWLQYNIPDRKFVTEVWLNSFFAEDNFLLLGITTFGKFKALTLKDIVSRDPWKALGVHKEKLSDKEFLYEGDITIKSRTGFINKLITNKEITSYNSINNKYNSKVLDLQPLLGMTTDIDSSTEKRFSFYLHIDQDNVHSNFQTAYERNITNLLLLSRTTIDISYTGIFHPHEVLDPVYVIDQHPIAEGFEDLYAGLYVVAKVARVFANKTMRTTLTLCRDTLNLE